MASHPAVGADSYFGCSDGPSDKSSPVQHPPTVDAGIIKVTNIPECRICGRFAAPAIGPVRAAFQSAVDKIKNLGQLRNGFRGMIDVGGAAHEKPFRLGRFSQCNERVVTDAAERREKPHSRIDRTKTVPDPFLSPLLAPRPGGRPSKGTDRQLQHHRQLRPCAVGVLRTGSSVVKRC